MALNVIWVFFFLVAFIIAALRLLFMADTAIFPALVQSVFEQAELGFQLSLGLTGVLALWLGFMKIAERGGMVQLLNRMVSPFFSRLFPEIPRNHPVMGSILMNFSMNILGLDNAATPLGIKAMEGLQTLNPAPERASNAQIMFLVLNTSGLTVIPVSVLVYRVQLGAANPADVFLPILLATAVSTVVGLLVVSAFQRINLWNRVVLAYLLGGIGLLGLLVYGFSLLEPGQMEQASLLISNLFLFGVIVAFLVAGLWKRVNVYEAFVEGAKEGFGVAIRIVPFLIAMLVGIGVFRTCGAMDYVSAAMAWCAEGLGFDTDFIPALPTALMKPLSGSGARGMMVSTMETYGVDSFAGRLSAVMQGSTETTLYVLAVYFGAVKIRKTRYALFCGLMADLAGVIAAIFLGYYFFH